MSFLDNPAEEILFYILLGILILMIFISFIREKRKTKDKKENSNNANHNDGKTEAWKIGNELRQNVKYSGDIVPIRKIIDYVQNRSKY